MSTATSHCDSATPVAESPVAVTPLASLAVTPRCMYTHPFTIQLVREIRAIPSVSGTNPSGRANSLRLANLSLSFLLACAPDACRLCNIRCGEPSVQGEESGFLVPTRPNQLGHLGQRCQLSAGSSCQGFEWTRALANGLPAIPHAVPSRVSWAAGDNVCGVVCSQLETGSGSCSNLG